MNVDEIYQEAERRYFLKNYQEALELFQKAQSLHNSGDYLNYIDCCYPELGKLVEEVGSVIP
jgi:tetratricopeptide (TPR) repeat protein